MPKVSTLRLTHSERLDQWLYDLETVIKIINGEVTDPITHSGHDLRGQPPERLRQHFDAEVAKLEERGIEFLLHGLLDAPPAVLHYYGLQDSNDIREKIKRVWALSVFRCKLTPPV